VTFYPPPSRHPHTVVFQAAHGAGFTLVEVVTSMVVLSVVMVTIGSTIVLASRAIPKRHMQNGTPSRQVKVLQQIAEDISTATWFLDRTAVSVRFLVPDCGDGGLEEIAYQWGGPLEMSCACI